MKFETMTLRELMEASERKKNLQSRLENLTWRIQQKERHCEDLRIQLEQEEADVLELQTGGIHAFFKTVFRDKNEILERERLEAAAAGAKYETAMTDLAKMKEEQSSWSQELTSLQGCEEVFQTRYEARKAELEQSGDEAGKTILQIEEKISKTKGRLREIAEAIRAADSALSQANMIQDSLRSAENWGTFDMLGGGLIASVAKRDHIDQAEQMIPELQRRLNRLRDELDDVSVTLNHTIDHSEFLRFADWFFDGLFVDWMVQDKIHDFQSEISSVQSRVRGIQTRLSAMREETEEVIETLEREVRDSVITA
ncbi:MAG: hypothetical protein IJ486_06985 [Firmicutes bacterium]|nr:hypothetical protein [Bacillota bacterium]